MNKFVDNPSLIGNEGVQINFEHKQSAHCENGVISSLLNHQGVSISEPMAFGIGSGLFFSYLPFIKLNGIPVTSYRVMPGGIFRTVAKRLKIKVKTQKFRKPHKAMEALDRVVEKGRPVGMLTSVFYLPYLPSALRFHFNAHNIIVYGKENGHYLVSDPVMDHTTTISYDDLLRARFAKGYPSPSGRMYYPVELPNDLDLREPIVKGMKWTADNIVRVPVPIFGIRGMRYVAKRIRKWPDKLGERKAILYLGNLIRMQEEIGTGGAGFRFIFAAFLQEAAQELQQEWLEDASKEMTEIGDQWRELAFAAGRICKNRAADGENFESIANMMKQQADLEQAFFTKLQNIQLR